MNPEHPELPRAEVSEEMQRHLEYYVAHRNELIEKAAQVRELGVSHRDPPFKVGCGLLAVERTPQGEKYADFTGYNITPVPKDRKGWQKRCAERNAVQEALLRDAELIVAMISVSKESNTGDENKAHDVLHPCRDCRDMLRELQAEGLIRDESIICNVNDSRKTERDPLGLIEERTLKELLDRYRDDLKNVT